MPSVITRKPVLLVSVLLAGVVMILSRPRPIASDEVHAPPKEWIRRRLINYRPSSTNYGWSFNDPRTVRAKDEARAPPVLSPLHVCGRKAPIPHEVDVEVTQKYHASCPGANNPESTTILLLEGLKTFGRMGNNLVELLHALQYGRDNGVVVGIMQGSWPIHLITPLWMAIQNEDIHAWSDFNEQALCVKIINNPEELERYEKVIRHETRDLFLYRYDGHKVGQYVEFQGHVIRALWRSHNTGAGVDIRHLGVGDMCSVVSAMFGNDKQSAVYSVIHSRSMEAVGADMLAKMCRKAGCDPLGALNMEPEYIKAILQPLGMLEHPILFITDHQRPEVLDKLRADPDIGPRIKLIPEEASWIGGDITVAVMSDVFIGNPASSFSGFIAKSRLALGYERTYLFRKKREDGVWVNSCAPNCIFDKTVMNALA